MSVGFQVPPTPRQGDQGEAAEDTVTEVVAELGRSRRSVVYCVRRGGAEYAMKVMLTSDGTAAALTAFHREAALLACVNHPGVARVHEVGVSAGLPFLVMDLFHGRRLTEVLVGGALPVSQVVAVAADVAEALAAAHRAGIVHRDVKPDNIIVSSDGPAGIVDFGLAGHIASEDRSRSDDLVTGTMLYCAPEQSGMLSRPVDGRADLYALGAVMYECATGVRPFDAADLATLMRMHAGTPPADPRCHRPELPEALATIILTLLAKDPDDRYQSAVGLAADLRLLAAGRADPPLQAADRPVDMMLSPRLVGRDAELATMQARWEQARGGAGGAVFLRGASGSGKSRLASELTSMVAGGALVLHGKSNPDDLVPLAPLRSAVERHVRTVDRLPPGERSEAVARLRAAAGPAGALLRRLSPALGDMIGAGELGEEDQRRQFVAAVAGFLTALAHGYGGAVLHLDDVQWADAATRAVLEAVAVDLPRTPMLLVATARDDAASTAAVAPLRAAFGDSPDAEIILRPLAAADVAELAASLAGGLRVDDGLAAQLAEQSGGSPFTAIQYFVAVVDAGLARPHWGRWKVDLDALSELRLPTSASELIRARLKRLDSDSSRILGAAAVLGTGFTPDLLAEVCATELQHVLAVMNGAVDGGLVTRDEQIGYHFVHDQIREELLSRMDVEAVREIHERAADALDGHPARDAARVYALASHCLLGMPERDPERTLRAATAAARLAMADQAPQEALALLERAGAVVGEVRIAADWQILQLRGLAQHRTGEFEAAAATLRRAHAMATETFARVRLLDQIARVYDSTWNTALQAEVVQEALGEMDAKLPASPLWQVATTFARFFAGLVMGATRIGFGAVAGRRRERYQLISALYEAAAMAETRQLRPVSALMFLLRGWFYVNLLGHGPERTRAAINSAHLARVLGLKRLARRLSTGAAAAAAQLQDPRLSSYVAWLDAIDSYMFGDDQGEQARAVHRDHRRWLDPGHSGDLLLVLHWDVLLRGEVAEAQTLYDRRETLIAEIGQGGPIANHAARACLLAMRGDARQARQHLADKRATADDRLPWQHVDNLFALLMSLVELRDLGPAFDDAVAEFEALRLSPLSLIQVQRGLYVCIAHGRIEQCRAAQAGSPDRAQRMSQARKAIATLRRIAEIPLYQGHYQVLKAAVRQLAGEPLAALNALHRAGPVLRTVDAAMLAYESARVRAFALRDLRVNGDAERTARLAMSIAIEQGWPVRVRQIAAEFGLVNVSPTISSAATPGSAGITLDQYRQRLAAVTQVGVAASRVLDPARLVGVALDESIRILGAERAFLFLVDPSTGQLRPHAGRDADGNDLAEPAGYSKTVVERTLRSLEATVVAGTEEGEALSADSIVAHGLRSILTAPLLLDGRLLGVIYLDSRIANGIFTADDVGVLTAITNQVAIILETTHTVQLRAIADAATQQRDVAERLQQAYAEVSTMVKPDQILDRLLTHLLALVDGEHGWLVRDATGGDVRITSAAAGQSDLLVIRPDPALAALLTADEVMSGPVSSGCPAFIHEAVGGIGHWMAVPLTSAGKRLGVLVFASARPQGYGNGQAQIAATLASQTMLAFQNAELFERTRIAATIDGLTGIANRRHLFEQSETLLRTRDDGTPVAAIMADIDHFKGINDTYGHDVGDQVIRTIAARLRDHLRDGDVLGRYGGEEFAVVLCTDTESGAAVAERLRQAVAGQAVDTAAGPLDVTMSLGVACLDGPAARIEDLLSHADRCLYEAKREGRNRVCTTTLLRDAPARDRRTSSVSTAA